MIKKPILSDYIKIKHRDQTNEIFCFIIGLVDFVFMILCFYILTNCLPHNENNVVKCEGLAEAVDIIFG